MNEDNGQRLYVIAPSEDGPCKIGIARDPDKRLRELQTGNPHKLGVYLISKCSNAQDFEYRAHRHLASKRMQGEWFDITVVEAAKTLCTLQSYDSNEIQAISIVDRFEDFMAIACKMLVFQVPEITDNAVHWGIDLAMTIGLTPERWQTMKGDWYDRGAPDENGIPQMPIEEMPLEQEDEAGNDR